MKGENHRSQQKEEQQEKPPPNTALLLLACLIWVGVALSLYMKWWSFGTNSRFEEWNVFLAASAFVAAVATGGFLLGQLKTLRGQLGVFREQADVMRGQLDAMREAERAFIGFLDFEITGKHNTLPTNGLLTAINSGKSPAQILAWTRDCKFLNESDTHPSATTESGDAGRVLAPGASMRTDVSADWFAATKGQHLHVLTEVRYLDLRSRTEHFTRLCWRHVSNDKGAYCQEYGGAT